MELLKKLFQIISKVVPAPALSEREALELARLNPEKFYVENVRSILGVSHNSAKRICETAVRQGVFERRIEVRCPDGSVAASAESEAALPKTVRCVHQEEQHFETEEVPTAELEKTVFYRLKDDADSIPYGQTA
ncbi:MAG: hypothetical protein LAO76_22380 [Acidobacteriia bacterium]|nr:hypothetical protein [Terriglobia bacterium]